MDWKRFAVAANYYGTLPWRQLAKRRACEQGLAPICVLSYRRVARSFPCEWSMVPDVFEQQIDWLQANFELISLYDAQHRLSSGRNQRPAVCITFDDGYSDNCNFSIPLIVERGIPCTYFVALKNVAERLPFLHDLQRGIPLEPNSVEQLKRMAGQGIEIGAHTRSHADVANIQDPHRLLDEIVTAGQELSMLIEQPVNYFAFPHGSFTHLTADAFRMAREAGFSGVVSAYGGYNYPVSDPFHLQRIHADAEMLRFRNAVTVDPIRVDRLGSSGFETLTTDLTSQEA